jgi:hypothetical protein
MRTSEAFVFGAIIGGIAVWLWGERSNAMSEKRLVACARGPWTAARVEEKTGQCSTAAKAPSVVPKVGAGTKERVTTALRAGQEAIRPAP